MRVFNCGMFLLIAGLQTAMAQDSIPRVLVSFEQAMQLTLQNNHVIKQTQFIQNEKEQAMKASRGLYLPKVGLTANYMVMSQDLTLDLTPVKDAITPLYATLANYGKFSGVVYNGVTLPDDQSTALVRSNLQTALTTINSAEWNQMIQKKQFGVLAATGQWPLYAGGKIQAANKAASIERTEADELMKQKEGELLSELVERYFGLSLARQAVMVRQDVFQGMQHHLSDAEKLQRDGLIANAEVLQARLYCSNADRELKKANRNVQILNEALRNTLSLEGDTLLEPATALFYTDTIEPVEYFIHSASEKNPLLMQVESKKKLAEINYKVQRSEFMPAVALMGTYNIMDKDLSEYTPDWMVGVGLKWTLFDGTARYHKIKAATAKNEQVEEFQEKAENDISTMIFKLYNELNMYKEQLTALESSTAFAEEYVRVRDKGFKEDMNNATEVIDARMNLAQVRIERLQAMYNYDLALARLLQYAGIPENFTNYQKGSNKTEVYQKINF